MIVACSNFKILSSNQVVFCFMLGSAWLSYKRIFMKSYQKFVTPAKLPLACSRLRDSGESEKSFKNKKTRGGWGETIAPFAKSRASYFRFARFTSALYYLRAWHRLNFPLFALPRFSKKTPLHTERSTETPWRREVQKFKLKRKTNRTQWSLQQRITYTLFQHEVTESFSVSAFVDQSANFPSE